jgi:hypothetical protein
VYYDKENEFLSPGAAGSQLLAVTDDGNGVGIITKDKYVSLDYSQMAAIEMFIKANGSYCGTIREVIDVD